MPDTGEGTEGTTETQEPGTGTGGAGAEEITDWKAEAEKWKAMSRKHEGEAKKGADARAKLTELEQASKSEVERERDAKAAAEGRASEAELRALRLEVAFDKGLTPAQAKRLVGATREELEADADELVATFKPAEDKGSPTIKPKPAQAGRRDPGQDEVR